MEEAGSDVEAHLCPASALEHPQPGGIAEYVLRHGTCLLRRPRAERYRLQFPGDAAPGPLGIFRSCHCEPVQLRSGQASRGNLFARQRRNRFRGAVPTIRRDRRRQPLGNRGESPMAAIA